MRRLPLAGLDRRATAALVQHIVGVEASLDYIAEVYRRTGGNPFFTSEVARLLHAMYSVNSPRSG